MKTLIEYGLKLLLVCTIAIAGIAGLYVTAKENIDANARADLENALAEVLGTSDGIEKVSEDPDVYVAEKDGRKIYAAEGGAQGYSSEVQIVLSAERAPDGRLLIVAVRVKSQQETPGLGTLIADQVTTDTFWSWIGSGFSSTDDGPAEYEFLGKFPGKTKANMRVTKDASEADQAILGISGATISSDATVKACAVALMKIEAALTAGR
jgi:Na+-translocating ferredoxin:NAD+ oxidoreductase RnfG subunit